MNQGNFVLMISFPRIILCVIRTDVTFLRLFHIVGRIVIWLMYYGLHFGLYPVMLQQTYLLHWIVSADVIGNKFAYLWSKFYKYARRKVGQYMFMFIIIDGKYRVSNSNVI